MRISEEKWVEVLKAGFERQKKLWLSTTPATANTVPQDQVNTAQEATGRKKAGQGADQKTHLHTLQQTQAEHFSRFLEKGLPTNKDPHWKFSATNPLFKTLFSPVLSLPQPAKNQQTKTSMAGHREEDLCSFPTAYKIHFHNGILQQSSQQSSRHSSQQSPRQDLPPGVKFCEWKNLTPDFPGYSWIIQSLKKDKDSFHHLNTAFPLNGCILYISPTTAQDNDSTSSSPSLHKQEKQAKNPKDHTSNPAPASSMPTLHIHFSFDELVFTHNKAQSATPALWNFKNFVFLKEHAKLTLIESFSIINTNNIHKHKHKHPENSNTHKKAPAQHSPPSNTKILINTTTEVKASAHATLKHLCIDQGAPASYLLNQVHCDLEQSARMDRLSFSLGSGLSKDSATVHHLGEKAHSSLLSLSLLKEKTWRDQRFYTRSAKQAYCRQLSRGILNDHAKNIFQGKICVPTSATQTDCAQSAKNLLLSPTADTCTQPELEIHCGDVKARHGATAGQLSKDEIFYLQSRGLEQKTAFALLLMAYITDVLNQFPEKQLIANLIAKIQKNKDSYLNL